MKHSLLVLLCASCLLTHNIHAGEENPLFPVKEGVKWGFINRAGEMVIKPQYAYCDDQFSEGLAPVRVDGSRSGYIDRNNKMVIPQQLWSSAESFRDGLAAVGGGTPFRFGYIDKTGKYVIEPRDGLSYGGFHDGLMKIKEGEKWGYIDKTGRVVIPPVFANATDLRAPKRNCSESAGANL